MARVRPFRAIRYASASTDITPLTAPPYDVVNESRRAELLSHNSHNIVALELPEGPLDVSLPGNRYDIGAARWTAWQREGVVTPDAEPGMYVLEQSWMNGEAAVRRVALIAAVRLERFENEVVLPHERTLPKALDDRLQLTRACAANFSPVFGLFSDPESQASAVFEAATHGDPIAWAMGDDEVKSTLWACTEEDALRRLESFFEGTRIFIADGHHRYSTALAYRDERRAREEPALHEREGERRPDTDQSEEEARDGHVPTDQPPYDFVMMALVNMDDPELVVLPTHRVVDSPKPFEPDTFWRGLTENFTVEDLPSGHPSRALGMQGPARFIVQTRDGRRRLVVLKDSVDLDDAIRVEMSHGWKRLDVAVLQELVLWPLLGVHPDRPETLDRLMFVKDAHEALKLTGEHDVAFILRPTRMQQLKDVTLAGETMPQKSTYFYPKMPSGFVMRSLA